MPQAWHISCTIEQVEGTVHTGRKTGTGSGKEFRFQRRGDPGSEEDHRRSVTGNRRF